MFIPLGNIILKSESLTHGVFNATFAYENKSSGALRQISSYTCSPNLFREEHSRTEVLPVTLIECFFKVIWSSAMFKQKTLYSYLFIDFLKILLVSENIQK